MKKAILALTVLASILMPALSSSSKGVYVLCYHAIKEKKDPYSFSQEQLKDQLLRMKKDGFRFVTFEDIKNGNITGTKNILVTVDDGNESVYSAYYNVMKPMGIKPVLGIYPAVIGKMHYALTWAQVKKLKDDGCYIASHGYNHMYLSSKSYTKDIVQFKKEIYLSKKILEQKLGITIDTMIYPFGVSSDEAIVMMTDAGYKYGLCLTQKRTEVPVADSFHIPRYMLTKPNQKGTLAFIMKDSGQQAIIADTRENNSPADNAGKPDYNMSDNNTAVKDRVTIRNYPDRLKKLVISDIVFLPDTKITPKQKKKHRAAKTNLRSVKKTVKKSEKKNKKIKYFPSKEHKKMTENDIYTKEKKHSFLQEVKDFYFDLLGKSSRFFATFRKIAWSKLELVKQKTTALFS